MSTTTIDGRHFCNESASHIFQKLDEIQATNPILRKILKVKLLVQHFEYDRAQEILVEIDRVEITDVPSKFGIVTVKIMLCWNLGKFEYIPDLIRYGKDLIAQIDSPSDTDLCLQGHYYNAVGNYFWDIGNTFDALSQYKSSYEIWLKLSDRTEIAKTHNNFGIIHYIRGEYKEALENYHQNIDLNRQINPDINISAPLSNIGEVYLDLGQLNLAEDYFSESIVNIKKHTPADLSALAYRYVNLGYVCILRGDLNHAGVYLNKATSIYNSLGNRPLMKRVEGFNSILQYLSDNLETAQNNLILSIKELARSEFHYDLPLLCYWMVQLQVSKGSIDSAEKWADTLAEYAATYDLPYIHQYNRLTTAIIAKEQRNIESLAKSMSILNEIINDPATIGIIGNHARLTLCEIFLMEFEIFNSPKQENQLLDLIGQIYKYGQKEVSIIHIIKALEYKSRILFSKRNVLRAYELLDIAILFANDKTLKHELHRLEGLKESFNQRIHHPLDSDGIAIHSTPINNEKEILSYLDFLKSNYFWNDN